MLTEQINSGRYITDIQLIQNVITGYRFIDYGLVTKYADGRVELTLAHKVNKKEVKLTNVEVLNTGSLAFSVQHTLVEGDIVMLFSSRSMVKDMTAFTEATDTPIDCYSTPAIKALPIAATGKSINTLTIADDGSYILVGENYTFDVATDGSISLTTAGDLSLSPDGDMTVETKGKLVLSTTTAAKITAKNSAQSLAALIEEFIGIFTNGFQTVGPPPAHLIRPDIIAKFVALNVKFKLLLE